MWPFGKRKREKRAREIAATAHLCENPSTAHSVREEYLHLSTRLCKCGGRLEAFNHELRYYRGQPRDVIEARCERCKASCCFVYDISFFFGKTFDEIPQYVPSELVDVMDWAHHGYTCLHQAEYASPDHLDNLLQDALWCFEEMAKFYPPNGKFPFPWAFFNHRAVHHSHMRLQYPRALMQEAITTAKSRLGTIDS